MLSVLSASPSCGERLTTAVADAKPKCVAPTMHTTKFLTSTHSKYCYCLIQCHRVVYMTIKWSSVQNLRIEFLLRYSCSRCGHCSPSRAKQYRRSLHPCGVPCVFEALIGWEQIYSIIYLTHALDDFDYMHRWLGRSAVNASGTIEPIYIFSQ